MALARLFGTQCSLVTRGVLFPRIQVPSLVSACSKQTVAEELGLPEPPKRPPSPYIRYINSQRDAVKRLFPSFNNTQITAKLASQWHELNQAEKNHWSISYQKDKEEYVKRLEEYTKRLTPVQMERMKDLKRKRSQDKVKRQIRREKKKETEELGKPKHPGNAFTLYLLSLDRGDAPLKEFLMGAASRWRRLPEQEQERFRERARKHREKYEAELRVWEARMIRNGRADLVRRHQQIEDLKNSGLRRRE